MRDSHGWSDLVGVYHQVQYAQPRRNRTPERRWCKSCGKLRPCVMRAGFLLCVDCGKKHTAMDEQDSTPRQRPNRVTPKDAANALTPSY
jgi:hypothetical protein